MRSDTKALPMRQPTADRDLNVASHRKVSKNLEDKFRETSASPLRERSKFAESCNAGVLKRINLAGSRKALRSGAEKITKTFRRVRNTFGTLTQHFALSRGRQRLTDTPCHTPHTPASPHARCKQVLGRTPTKLYSPFGIETPHYTADLHHDKHLTPATPEHELSPLRKRGRSLAQPWRFMSRRPRSLFR